MGFLQNIFKSKENKIEEDKDIFISPVMEDKWECKFCELGIDPKFHKYTKQGGNYFHKMCWKKAVRITKTNGMV
jgi:hypothetical protein